MSLGGVGVIGTAGGVAGRGNGTGCDIMSGAIDGPAIPPGSPREVPRAFPFHAGPGAW